MENDEIARYLSALEREDCFRVDATLKESPHELTQRVFFVGANGAEQGPFVRKFIHRESGMGNAYERIFEAQRAGKRFKHVPLIQECYRRDGFLVVVMEFVTGETLQDLVYRRDPSAQLAADVFPQLCDAVAELHEAFDPPLIHRDLKPSNIMFAQGAVTIIDFGIARDFKDGAEADTTKFGTRAFAPPEQFGFGQTTVRSDAYALGMLLYFCLTERIPTPQVRDAKFREDDVPTHLRPLLACATALDPGERYASAEELKAAFLEVADYPGDRQVVKHRRTTAIALACAAILIAAAVCALFAAGAFNQVEIQAEQAASATSQSPGALSESNAAASTQETAEPAEAAETAEAAVLDGMQTNAPLRDDFDPATNIRATVADVTFQIPSCFGASISRGEGSVTYYYAESGSSLAMIMTGEDEINADSDADSDGAAGGFRDAKDEYLIGLLRSNEELFAEVASSVDLELAGHSARIVTIKGTLQNHVVTTKAVYFINEGVDESANAIGSIILGQTANAQFDYSTDFAKTIASATPAT